MNAKQSAAMHRASFEGSYLGDNSRLQDDSVMECKICWYTYDPLAGDEYWQVAPNTPFSALPEYWRCPECDGEREQFMQVHEQSGI